MTTVHKKGGQGQSALGKRHAPSNCKASRRSTASILPAVAMRSHVYRTQKREFNNSKIRTTRPLFDRCDGLAVVLVGPEQKGVWWPFLSSHFCATKSVVCQSLSFPSMTFWSTLAGSSRTSDG